MVSIVLVEAVILVPSYKGYERDLLSKLRESGRATVTSGFKKYGTDSQRDLPLVGRLLTNDSYLRGGALYRPDGSLIGRFGDRPRLTPGLAESKSITTWRQEDGARLDVIWRPQQTGLPFTVVGRLDSSWIGGELVKFVLRISGLVLIVSLFVSGATMLVLRKMILVPLLQLRASLIAASKDPDNPERYTLDLKRDDEFGDVVESFNNLLQLISHSLRSALAEQSELLETTFQSMSQGIVVYDRDLKVIAFNQKYENLCDYPPGFLHVGTSFEEIVRFRAERGDYGPPTDIEALVRERAQIRRQGDLARRELIGQDDTEVVVSRDTMPNGGYVTTFTDITEIKRAEEALRESEARFRAVVDNSPTKIHIKDAEGRYTLVNPLAEKLFGFTDEEARGKTSYDIFPKEVADAFTAHDRAVVESRETVEEVEHFTLEDGEHTYLTVKFPILDGQGGVAGVAAIGTDITMRKQAEEALRESERTLQERVVKLKEARRRLKSYAKELVRSNEELEQFAYVASHDLQEPLRKVQAFGDRLMKRYSDALGEDGQDYIVRMQDAAGRMQTLIQSLLNFSRVATKGQPFIPVNLNELMKSILSDLEIPIQETGARVKVANLPTIDADPSQMRQLFQNLIGNALKYRRENVPPKIELASEFVSIESGTPKNRHGGLCQIKVLDNGIGFEEQYAERIFGIFQRLHGREQYEGTGVGLAITRKIAERHGGSITANGRPGEGATFTVILPVSHPTSEGD